MDQRCPALMLVAVFDFTPHALENVPIGDCMRHGMVSCDHVASLAEVAAIMTAQRVHAVVVTDESGRPSGIISDLDVIAGAASEEDLTAGTVRISEVISAPSTCSLRDAARLMAEHRVAHLIVRDHSTGRPVGMLSSSDFLSAYALAAKTVT